MDTFEPGQDSAPEPIEATSAENNPQPTEPTAGDQPQEFSGHPAWKPFEEALGPIHYRAVEPHLRSMNQAFESKIAATNKSLEPWRGFIDDGVDPEELRFTRQLAQEINTDPLGFYQKLETYLRQTGQLEAAAQAAQVADSLGGESDPEEDPTITQLKQQLELLQAQQAEAQQGQLAWMHQQQYEREVAGVQSQLENEVQALKAKGADDRTIKAVLDRAELHHLRGGKPQSLDEHYAAIAQEQQFIRNQPQAVDRAPRLPGVTGGAPSQGATDLSTANRSQSIDTLAALIEANKGR